MLYRVVPADEGGDRLSGTAGAGPDNVYVNIFQPRSSSTGKTAVGLFESSRKSGPVPTASTVPSPALDLGSRPVSIRQSRRDSGFRTRMQFGRHYFQSRHEVLPQFGEKTASRFHGFPGLVKGLVKTEYRARRRFVNILQERVDEARGPVAGPAVRNRDSVPSLQFHLGMRSRILSYPSSDMLYGGVLADEGSRQVLAKASPDNVHADLFQLRSSIASRGPATRPRRDFPVMMVYLLAWKKTSKTRAEETFRQGGQLSIIR